MTANPWTGIYILTALIGLVFILLLASFFPKSTIEFTNLPSSETIEPIILASDPMLGDLTSGFGFWQKTDENKIIIIHYGNSTCNSCARTAKALLNIYQDFEGEVVIVWKDFPNPTIDIESLNSAIAARCADKQNRFWEYEKYLLDNYHNASTELYQEIATDLNLGLWRFNSCYNNQKTVDLIEASYQEALDLKLSAAPTTYIDGQWYTGELSEAELRSIILDIQNTAK
ncbi:hypothetical protein CO057_01850 [Candidatus Uhrbacteria bacterium CG_4_9_14_0_2_um_filter_41_50]|uniref:Thioredoxin-like fold domain-containing protein n=1 Tax=Candidatus Uhrbacteria bacterium CG_4_9_14_0_2_um_filter_41_50 TaxID=1975031 RepID=A0A2M8EPG2_9BACT|nr:MAG: hypothetical protein COZ45_01170 [Candidatus Uhrbacteria bacterium CG_4_10_14_3_um_filter_41_21]PIZ54875.1 MAG: hypothetical protein COY24_02285 [Candidatus Uhrbacteria bacterium CG_4_10_14_0_2_um_filter_41_21]PJB84713.1 MAG: hypothetical protein CO086_02170 [Candidatus Uhrbacteria bacterium CG_4_9_14_0_8_um_filter_41_16]PJC24629.1 MAG: hypothetical protein CO057_01850 [Candidatus Uhrbacteria bacterium CG_4_9_14_0_2_um_filter_41_50]PJE75401.1 MAG: hypothetical protein COV03_00340 [Candi